MRMETANVMVNIGGDAGYQVPKYGVTPSEIAVLRGIHGDEAVHDIEPSGFIDRAGAEERQRLFGFYGKLQDGKDISPVGALFPGANARMIERLADLDIPEEFYKATGRMSAAPAVKKDADTLVAPAAEQAGLADDEGGFEPIRDAHSAVVGSRGEEPADIFK